MMRKVVIIGPESTGKSTLAGQLAAHLQTYCVPEFARDYLSEHGTAYSFEDLLVIANGQLELEEKYIKQVQFQFASTVKDEQMKEKVKDLFVVIDTDMYVMKVWCEFVFQQCHLWILDRIVERKYDLYLLCNVDLPWVADHLREYPELESREKLYHIYKDILINQNVPWIDISGGYDERLEKAIAGIRKYLS
jgi:NadR type nicotinamide-nucleotide adenylyltransferase